MDLNKNEKKEVLLHHQQQQQQRSGDIKSEVKRNPSGGGGGGGGENWDVTGASDSAVVARLAAAGFYASGPSSDQEMIYRAELLKAHKERTGEMTRSEIEARYAAQQKRQWAELKQAEQLRRDQLKAAADEKRKATNTTMTAAAKEQKNVSELDLLFNRLSIREGKRDARKRRRTGLASFLDDLTTARRKLEMDADEEEEEEDSDEEDEESKDKDGDVIMDNNNAAKRSKLAEPEEHAEAEFDDDDEDSDLEEDEDDEPTCDGERRFKKLKETIDMIFQISGLRKEASTMMFIETFMNASAHLVYGEADWETHKAKFFRKNRMTRLARMVCIVAPRRFGKTIAIAIFALAMVLTVPSLPIAIFSTNQRTAQWITKQCARWLSQFPRGNERTCTVSTNLIAVISEEAISECRTASERRNHPSISQIIPMPGTVDGSRGIGGKILIMEEASFVPPKVWELVCLPLLGVRGAVMLGISTPSGKADNFYGGLISRLGDGSNPAFILKLIGLSCDFCRANNRAAQCTHESHWLPVWKDEEGQKLLKQLLSDNAFRQEAQGEQLKESIPCFKAWEVDAVWRKERRKITGENGIVFLSVDPSGGGGAGMGGRGSETAMMAFVYDQHDDIVAS